MLTRFFYEGSELPTNSESKNGRTIQINGRKYFEGTSRVGIRHLKDLFVLNIWKLVVL